MQKMVKTISRFSLQVELITCFLLVATIPLIVISVVTSLKSTNALKEATYGKLLAVQAIKKNQIKELFGKFDSDVKGVAGSQQLIGSIYMLSEYADTIYDQDESASTDGPYPLSQEFDTSIYQHVAVYPKEFTETYGYDDLILINEHGQVPFTLTRLKDMGTNLRTGPLKDSPLERIWSKVLKTKKPVSQDFMYYEPDGKPVSFLAAPVISQDGDDSIMAVVVLKVGASFFNKIMIERTGMGKTGLFYLLGKAANNTIEFRSDIELKSEKGTEKHVVGEKVTYQYLKESLFDKGVAQGVHEDEQGNKVIVTSMPVGLAEVSWCIAAKIDYDEAMQAVASLRTWAQWITIIGVLIVLVAVILFTNYLRHNLNIIVDKLKVSAVEVDGASSGLAGASQTLAQGASSQASSIEETSASLEELASMANHNSDNAQQANNLSNEARLAAEDGSKAMDRLVDVMSGINESSEEVAKVAKGIEEIAFQTNLLALNAAVEAARAGEAGKGFAVVAEEVRNLAQRASEQARVTSTLITESRTRTKDGSEQASDANKVLKVILEKVEKAVGLVSEIAAASKEQAQGIDQINRAVSSMDQIVQQNSASAQETSSSSEELSAQAASMKAVVTELVIFANGETAGKRDMEETFRQSQSAHHQTTSSVETAPQHRQITSADEGGDDFEGIDF